MKILFFYIIVLFCSFACTKPQVTDNADVLVKLNDRMLYKRDLNTVIPKGISSADSLLIAESYIKKWVKEGLVLEVSRRNMDDEQSDIEKLVEDYRNSLMRYRYQEKLVKEKLSAEIKESDKVQYYEENPKKFLLDKNLIKGLFLKIPIDAPNLSQVREWYKSNKEVSIEKIEKYSVQYASIYEYFFDKWVDFDDVMDNIPEHIANPVSFLKNNKTLEVKDSLYYYFLNIKQYLPEGSTAPYDYAEPEIQDILVNQRRLEFLKNFEDELYNDAIRKNKVTYYSEKQEAL